MVAPACPVRGRATLACQRPAAVEWTVVTVRQWLPDGWAFDAGPKPSLLPGLLAATRTGLTPAGDDKLALKITNYISTSNSWVNGPAKIRPKCAIAL